MMKHTVEYLDSLGVVPTHVMRTGFDAEGYFDRDGEFYTWPLKFVWTRFTEAVAKDVSEGRVH